MVIQSSESEKLQEENPLAIFNPGYGEHVFSDAAKNSTMFSRN